MTNEPTTPEVGGEWIEWHGGENPVPGKRVVVRFRDGFIPHQSSLSEEWDWSHNSPKRRLAKGSDDIIAYRLAQPEPLLPGEGEGLRAIVSDEEVVRVHGFANFGDMTPREVVNDGVLKLAFGYHTGHTQMTILREHGLITKPRGYDADLTKKGKRYARALRQLESRPQPQSPIDGEVVDVLRSLADDLEAEIQSRANSELPRRITRDMEIVTRARCLLAKLGAG